MPLTGSQPSCTAKNNWKIRPSQNMGRAMPDTASIRIRWSTHVSRQIAASMPNPMPPAMPTSMAVPTNSIVFGRVSASSPVTLRVVEIDRPKSPRASPST